MLETDPSFPSCCQERVKYEAKVLHTTQYERIYPSADPATDMIYRQLLQVRTEGFGRRPVPACTLER